MEHCVPLRDAGMRQNNVRRSDASNGGLDVRQTERTYIETHDRRVHAEGEFDFRIEDQLALGEAVQRLRSRIDLRIDVVASWRRDDLRPCGVDGLGHALRLGRIWERIGRICWDATER